MNDLPPVLVLAGLLAYLAGGIPLGWLLVRRHVYGLDIRGYGSGNVGASNVYRHAGLRLGAIVGVGQFMLGATAVLVARLLHLDGAEQGIVGLCAVVGNGWPVYLRFNGGRGVAVASGAVAALTPWTLPVLLSGYAAGALGRHLAPGVLAGFVMYTVVEATVDGATGASIAAALLAIILMRRVEGITADARTAGWSRRLVADRVLHDRRPGRPLEGPRTDPGAVARRGSTPGTSSPQGGVP